MFWKGLLFVNGASGSKAGLLLERRSTCPPPSPPCSQFQRKCRQKVRCCRRPVAVPFCSSFVARCSATIYFSQCPCPTPLARPETGEPGPSRPGCAAVELCCELLFSGHGLLEHRGILSPRGPLPGSKQDALNATELTERLLE